MLRMKRFCPASVVAMSNGVVFPSATTETARNGTFSSSSATTTTASPFLTQRRFLKAHDVREYKPLGMPMEMKFYQRFTTRPDHHSGVQFLTHYEDHRRFNIKRDFIDYFNWGKEQGQAHLPHRHHRVAFDFNDRVNPTVLPNNSKSGLFAGQDPSMSGHPDLSADFNPNKQMYSEAQHFSRVWTEYLPGQAEVRMMRHGQSPLASKGLDGMLLSHSHTGDLKKDFLGHLPGLENKQKLHPWGLDGMAIDRVGFVPGRVPGLNMPYRGELDTQHMQAMSQPLTEDNRVTGNDGRFSKTLYINDPTRDNVLTADLAKNLAEQIDMATNGVHSKLVVLKAAQSGITDRFSAGMDVEQYSYDISMAEVYEAEARRISEELSSSSSSSSKLTNIHKQALSTRLNEKLDLALRHRMRVDDALRSQLGLLWRTFTAARPLMTFVNGRCHNTGCGLALLSKYPALRDSTELIVDGPNFGATPFGGMTNLLARPETTGKMPGLAEYTVLTGNALYAGDALRLGWSEFFTSYSDMDFHIKEWFDATEHMHTDAVAWQLGHLLGKCFRMEEHHSTALERSAITPTRAKWIEDAFADQKSVESIIETLTAMEQLPTGPSTKEAVAAGNTFDLANVTPFSLSTIDQGIEKLQKNNLSFALAPWDITAPTSEDVVGFTDIQTSGDGETAKSNFASVFTNYVFERDAKGREVAVLSPADRARMKAWRKQRYQEYNDHINMMNQPVKRHVFARVEGCDGKLVDFEFFFDRKQAEAELAAANGGGASSSSAPSASNAMVKQVLQQVVEKMGYDPTRPLELGWYLPTLDTAGIRTDDELMAVLQHDPGFEAPSDVHGPTAHPPIYFIVKRATLHMSEWAYATKHQLLLSSPFALKASFQLLNDVRNGRAGSIKKEQKAAMSEVEVAESSIQSISETLATEFRYISRMVKRPDFYKIGFNSTRTMSQWEELEESNAVHLHLSDKPTARPSVSYDDVFARNVTVSGHKFLLRPRWSPATLEEVSDADIAALQEPLDFEKDGGITEIHVPTHTNKVTRIAAAINDIGGFEVVPGLGEPVVAGGKSTTEMRVAPLESDARVPNNVNFYIMARHPWTDQANSWRQDTFTDASLAYMTDKYNDALTQINRSANTHNNNRGNNNAADVNSQNSNYWPTRSEVDGDGKFEAEEESLLRDRLYNVVSDATNKVELWASSLRAAAQNKQLDYKIEITSQQERFMDENYYRWFIRPGEHPNPSGLLRDGKAVKAAASDSGAEGSIDPETLMASFDENASIVGGSSDVAGDSETAAAVPEE